MQINNQYFTQIGRDIKSGLYKKLEKGTYEYNDFWEYVTEKCYKGDSVGGVHMDGKLWSYVNFGTILRLPPGAKHHGLEGNSHGKKPGLPELRDVEFEINYYLTEARLQKLNVHLVGPRRLGKTAYITWAESVYPANFLDQWVGACSYNDDKLTDYMAQVMRHLNGLNDTELRMPILRNSENNLIFGHKRKIDGNLFEDVETGGKISQRVCYNNTMAFNGTSLYSAVLEESGICPNFKKVYLHSSPAWQEGGVNFGMFVSLGTGGDMDGNSNDSAIMFESPDELGFLSSLDEKGKKICTFIHGSAAFDQFRDENGILNKKAATKYMDERAEYLKNSKDLEAYLNWIQYYPTSWRKAFLKSSGVLFTDAIPMIDDQLIEISDSRIDDFMIKGYFKTKPLSHEIVLENGEPVFIVDELAQEVQYPVKPGANKVGCVVIYKRPFRLNGKIPDGLYIAGTDPYKENVANSSDSVASTLIYVRFNNYGIESRMLVAEYTGRPLTDEHYYEQLIGLLLYYNAITLHENEVKGIPGYFKKRGFIHLLKKQPQILKNIIKDSDVEREYGVHMPIVVKLYIIKLIKNFLIRLVSEGVYNVSTIWFRWVLEELKTATLENNADRLIALGLVLLHDESIFEEDVDLITNNVKDEMVEYIYGDVQQYTKSNDFRNKTEQSIIDFLQGL